MPQVVSILTKDEHKQLSQRAKLARRSLGNQLIAEAFQSAGKEVPEYLNKPAKRAVKKSAKAKA